MGTVGGEKKKSTSAGYHSATDVEPLSSKKERSTAGVNEARKGMEKRNDTRAGKSEGPIIYKSVIRFLELSPWKTALENQGRGKVVLGTFQGRRKKTQAVSMGKTISGSLDIQTQVSGNSCCHVYENLRTS